LVVERTNGGAPRAVEARSEPKTFDGTPHGGKPLAGDDALFLSNLEEDPGESRNLRHAHASVADELQTMIGQWMKTVKDR
jgi:hypothetical protein